MNGPRNYYANTKEVEGGEFEITNIYVPPTTSVLGKKVWVGGPELKPDVTLQLMRDGEAFRNPVTLTDGEDYYLWTGLDDTSGYKYTVKEVNVPENYKATYSEDGRTITNTYIVPKTDITGSKVWFGGPSAKPTVELQLYKDGEKHLEPVLLENNKTSYTWKSLDKTDLDGNEFTYTIKEVNTPKDYKDTYSEDGLTVTNTYVSEKIDVTGSKEWIGGPDVKPTIQLQLYRNNNAYLDPVTLVNGNLEHTWKDLDYKDSNGEMYTYTISEIEVPEDYDAYISEDGLTVTNVHFSSEGEYDPNGSKPLVPPTGINNNQLFYLSTLTLGGLGLIALRRKREKEFN